ncbi:hypothetical protein C8R46DRAFT_1034136 [Mycena filopes]|nr:hypothetical protein C8R46DRAFT_1034136 [Mycena filopes]
MSKLLAGLNFPTDFKLGPQHLDSGNTVHRYVWSRTGEPVEVLIIGTLSAVMDRPEKPTVLVLDAPEGQFPIIGSIFRKQTEILRKMMEYEGDDCSKVLPASMSTIRANR